MVFMDDFGVLGLRGSDISQPYPPAGRPSGAGDIPAVEKGTLSRRSLHFQHQRSSSGRLSTTHRFLLQQCVLLGQRWVPDYVPESF